MDAGANAAVLPVLSVASLVGFGAVVAAMPAFELVRDWVLSIQGGLLVSLALSTNILAALTGSASGGMTIALDARGGTYLALADDPLLRERATTTSTFDPPEAGRGRPAPEEPPFTVAFAPLVVVVAVNLLMSFVVLPLLDDVEAQPPCIGGARVAGIGSRLRGPGQWFWNRLMNS